jgi:hypothetical protein
MKTALPCAAVLAFLGFADAASAQYYAPALRRPVGNAPDMMGPGMYFVNYSGMVSGPHYYVVPGWCPETGFAPGPRPCRPVQGAPIPGPMPTVNSFPSHPYARSPRDFYMFHENLEAERSRELRPIIVP